MRRLCMLLLFYLLVLSLATAENATLPLCTGLGAITPLQRGQAASGKLPHVLAALDAIGKRTVSADQISSVVDAAVSAGHLAYQVEDPPKMELPLGGPMQRYGHSSQTQNYTAFGQRGSSGAVFIRAEPERADENQYSQFHVPPHKHPGQHHISIVTEGEGTFYLWEPARARAVPVKRGTVVIIPAGTPHTFWAGRRGISVLSVSSNFVPVDDPTFAERSPIPDWTPVRHENPIPLASLGE